MDLTDDEKFKKLMITLLGVVIALLVLNLLLSFQRYSVQTLKPYYTQDGMIKEDICYLGFESIVKKNPIKEMIDSGAYNALIESNFKIFEIENLLAIRKPKLNENICQIVIKDTQGLRSFSIELVNEGIYGSVIKTIKEIEIGLVTGGER